MQTTDKKLIITNKALLAQIEEKDQRLSKLMFANNELAESERKLRLSQRAGGISTWEWDVKTDVITWTEQVSHLIGFRPEQLKITYKKYLEIIHVDDRKRVDSLIAECIKSGSEYNIDYRIVWDNGRIVWINEKGKAYRDARGVTEKLNGVIMDITKRKLAEEKLVHIAHYDELTNLPNRSLLSEHLSQAMLQCQRHEYSLAVAFLDLDGFKDVNDTYGHDTGDKLLIEISMRMRKALRVQDILARIGGDEFVAVLTGLEKIGDCEPVLQRLLVASSKPITVTDLKLNVSVSIGVTLYPQDNLNSDQLIRQADQAMYNAKVSGKNCYHFFDTTQNSAVITKREKLEDIRAGIDKQQFVIFYQPKVNMKTGIVIGFEALIRWQHPKLGLLAPIDFLPVIENHTMMVELGEWVISRVLIQITQWKKEGLIFPAGVSVNIAAIQLQQEDFTERLTQILALYPDVDPSTLELEILETSALDDVQQISRIMSDCMKLGINFALDDFGTGYSSLTYLRRLPANLIKIDQSFVRDMLVDPDDLAIVEGVIGLAKSFKRQVIAEGVETINHGIKLMQLGCELAQGHGIAKPMPACDVSTWVNEWKLDVNWRN